MIIDTESHLVYRVFPLEINPGRSPIFRATWHEYSGDLFAAEMDRAGVDRTFLISYDAEDILWYLQLEGAGMEDCIAGKKYTLEQGVKKHPSRFLWFATLKDPARHGLEPAKQDLDDGALGLKIFPAFLQKRVDDEELLAVYRLCAETNRRVILSFEDTRPPETSTVAEFCDQLGRVLEEFPELQVQLNHAGASGPHDPASDPLNAEADVVFRVTERHDNIRLSTAWLGKVWDDESEYPYSKYLQRLERIKDAVGAEKMMWATDWPWLEEFMNYPQAVNAIRRHAHFFSEEERDLFLGDNAHRFVEELLDDYSNAPIFSEERVGSQTGSVG
jgi:predicted TIM-barrel fold metal-dependent hydrolase